MGVLTLLMLTSAQWMFLKTVGLSEILQHSQ